MELVLGFAGALLIAFGVWANAELTRVRTKVLAAAPDLDCAIGTEGSGLHVAIHNSGQVRAHNLSLSLPDMNSVWHQAFIERDDRARFHISIPEGAPLRTTKMVNPVATLAFQDPFDHAHALTITLTQTLRDDGRINLGSLPGTRVERPVLAGRQLWRLQKRV